MIDARAAKLSDYTYPITVGHLHYDVTRAKPDGSCSRPAETGPSFPGGKASGQYWNSIEVNTENNVAHGSHGGNCLWRLV